MHIRIRKVQDTDVKDVVHIFNYFVRESFAAYSDEEMDEEFFNRNKNLAKVFYVIEVDNHIIGFAYLKPFRKYKNFNHSGMLVYQNIQEKELERKCSIF